MRPDTRKARPGEGTSHLDEETHTSLHTGQKAAPDGVAIITELILPKLERVRCHGTWWSASCPVTTSHKNGDRDPSLTISRGQHQPVVMRCHKVDSTADILAAIGLTWRDICGGRELQQRDPEAIFRYTDENHVVLYECVRFPGKQNRMRRPDGRGGYIWNLDGVRNVPYNLPAILAAKPSDLIWICEGEKDCRAMQAADEIATCHRNGANAKWPTEFAPYFTGRDVLVVADRDKPGWKHAVDVYTKLRNVTKSIWIVYAATGKDAADHLNAGLSVTDFAWWDPPSEPHTHPDGTTFDSFCSICMQTVRKTENHGNRENNSKDAANE